MERRSSTGRSSDKFSPLVCRNLVSFFSPNNSEDEAKTITPRRKLSLDDSSQSPLARLSVDGKGTGNAGSSPNSLPSTSSELRTPLASVRNCSDRRRLTARLKSKHLSLSLKPDKENTNSDSIDPLTSAPSLPLSPFTSTNALSKTVMQQINSPLERMTLASPASTLTSTSSFFSSSSSSSSSNPSGGESSDGYFSDVFDVLDEHKDSHDIQSMPESFLGLFSGHVCQQAVTSNQTALPANDDQQTTTFVQRDRKGSLKRCLTTHQLGEGERCPKRPPVPGLTDSPPPATPKKNLKGVALFRSQSYSLPPSENAMLLSSPGDDVERIGDHSKPYALPLIKSPKVTDLKCIGSETLCRLLEGGYSDIVDGFTIVDCRYPYEYEGGHIKDAINIWEKDTLLEMFFSSPSHPEEKREIIIFHCEFSSKRGPEMCRFMRKVDREQNGMNFPSLYYPELYLLEGGYKRFYEDDSRPQCMCTPQAYRLMLDDHHRDQLRHFQKRSKSWSGESKRHRFSKRSNSIL